MNKFLKEKILFPFNVLYKVNPKKSLELLFFLKHRQKLNLKKPSTYNEKLNWLKLYYRNDLMPKCADKYTAREYIAEKGYADYLPKLLWHGDDPEQIPFEKLPKSFVIKSTAGSGNNIIVHDKEELDVLKTKRKIKKWLKEKYLPAYGEWHYAFIKPSIIVEELLSDGENFVPIDYKFFCFNNARCSNEVGVGCIAVDVGRYLEHKRLIYNSEFGFMAEVLFGFNNQTDIKIEKPLMFDEMCEIAKEIARPFPHCRVDFFVIGKQFYIGEITFFNGAGFDLVTPVEYNEQMGSWIKMPEKRC